MTDEEQNPLAGEMINPAMKAAATNPRLALLALTRAAIEMLAGGEHSHGPTCPTCGHGTPGPTKDAIRVALACLGIEGTIESTDLEDGGRLGPYGDPAVTARSLQNDQEYGLSYDVRSFQLRFGQACRGTPTIPPEDEMRHRARLVTEEYLEFMTAIFGYGQTGRYRGKIDEAGVHLADIIREAPVQVDLPELADASVDLKYVLEGTDATCGIDGVRIHKAVHTANMAKRPVLGPNGKPDPHSKPTKPEGWAHPDTKKLLQEQGWDG